MAKVNIGSNLHVKSYTKEKTYNNVSMNSFAMTADEEGGAKPLEPIELEYFGVSELTEAGLSTSKFSKFEMSALETVEADNAFAYAAGYKNTYFTAVHFPKLEVVHGDNAFAYAWYNAQNINDIDIHSLRDISGKSAFSHVFYSCNYNTSTAQDTLDLGNLEYIGHKEDDPADNEEICCYTFYYNKFKHLNMPKLKVINGHRACYQMFYYCSELLDFPGWEELEEINGDEACYQMFGYCSKIPSSYNTQVFRFPKLKKITGNTIFYGLFTSSSNIKPPYSIYAPLLEEIHGNGVFSNDGSNQAKYILSDLSSLRIIEGNNIFYKVNGDLNLPALQYVKGTSTFSSNCVDNTGTTVSLPELLEVEGESNFSSTWSNNYVQTINLPKLTKIEGQKIFASAFALKSNVAITTNPILFTSLSKIIELGTTAQAYNFYNAFHYRKNVEISFPALKSDSFDGSVQTFTATNHPFYNMFGSGSNNTVHLPSNLANVTVGSATMGDWVLNGTNNTIVFDLDPTE